MTVAHKQMYNALYISWLRPKCLTRETFARPPRRPAGREPCYHTEHAYQSRKPVVTYVVDTEATQRTSA